MPTISQDTGDVCVNFSNRWLDSERESAREDGIPFERDVFQEQTWLPFELPARQISNSSEDEFCRQMSKILCEDVRSAVRCEFESLQTELKSLLERIREVVGSESKSSQQSNVKFPKEIKAEVVPRTFQSRKSASSMGLSMQESIRYSRRSSFEGAGENMRKTFSCQPKFRTTNGSTSQLGFPSESSMTQTFGREWVVLGNDEETTAGDLRIAVQNNDIESLRRLLDNKANPNMVFPQIGCKSKQYLECSVVSLAALNEEIEMVAALVEYRADINGKYGFKAGVHGMHWSGAAVFAPVPRGNLSMLKEMLGLRANPHAEASNGSNLVWQSCYFGHEEILRYVLSLDVNPNVPALSQDQKGVKYTPLHIASLHGRDAIVEELLYGNADPNPSQGDNEVKVSPLSDAISHTQPNIVRSLVTSGARINDPQHRVSKAPSHDDSVLDSAGDLGAGSSLDLLFRDGFSNPVIVHAVAQGLQNQDQQVKNLTINDVCKFLSTPGQSPSAIMDAIFKKRIIKYRNIDNIPEQVRTALIQRAQILPGGFRAAHLNTATTPHTWDTMETWFKDRRKWDAQDKIFLQSLAPQNHKRGDNNHDMLAIVTYESLVPNIQNDLRVIRALTSSVDQEVFGIRHCQAIIQSSWDINRQYQLYDVIIQATLHVWYMALTLYTRDSDITLVSARLIAISGLPFCILQVLATMCELFAYWEKRWIRDSIVLLTYIIADSVTATVFGMLGADALDWFLFRFFFGVSCCLKWVKLLNSLTPYRRFGMPVLPILATMGDILPFCGVFFFYILGIIHAIVVMNVSGEDWHSSVYNTIAFVFTAEMPLLELVNFDILAEKLIVQLFVIVVGFAVPVTMMNTFIAALNGSYKQSIKCMEKLYQKRCAKCILRLLAIRDTISRFRGCARHFQQSRMREDLEPRYLWYSLEAPDEGSSDIAAAKAQKDLIRKSAYGLLAHSS